MAEAPPPPPNLSYNEFRKWRTSKGIRSTKEELSTAWREYSATKTSPKRSTRRQSPVRQSPVRQSPVRQSPVRTKSYGGLVSASLTGLPPDVQRIVSTNIGRESIYGMQLATKGTGRYVAEQLEELCRQELTPSEILNGLDAISLPISVRIKSRFSTNPIGGELILIYNKNGRIRLQWMEGTMSYYLDEVIQNEKKPIKKFLEQRVNGLVAMGGDDEIGVGPLTTYKLYLRRGSCLKQKNAVEYKRNILDMMRKMILEAAREVYNDFPHASWLQIKEMITGERDPQTWTRIIIVDGASVYEKRARTVAWITSDVDLINITNTIMTQIKKTKVKSKKVTKLRELAIATITSLRNAYNTA